MNSSKVKYENKNILITPLDWGLGHAGRCIPIIYRLIKLNNKVFIAGSGDSLQVLKNEFPELTSFELPPYNIKYSRRFLVFKLLFSVFSILKTIRKEIKCVASIVRDNDISVIISDNRFGCYNKNAESIFITHQIRVLLPWYLKFLEYPAFLINKHLTRKFDAYWIPDFENAENLTGILSHSFKLKNTLFIGPISRYENIEINTVIDCDILILLSGPEPLRTDLEKKLLQIFGNTTKSVCMVRGSASKMEYASPKNFIIYNLADGKEILSMIKGAKLIIARSGYSTIMDLVYVKKEAVLIPTPGQTEQEYLAEYLKDRKEFRFFRQSEVEKLLLI